MIETSRQEAVRLWTQMKRERDPWIPIWRDGARLVLPWRGKYLQSDRPNESKITGADIVNSIATRSVRTSASGMQSSLTNPARPWFRLTTADPRLAELGAVRGYLFQVERLVQWIFARSNLYSALHLSYRDGITFGTAPIRIDEDDEDVIRAHVLPVGQYALSCNARQRVDGEGRELSYTVRQLVQRFGRGRLSKRVRDLYKRGELNQWVQVVNLVLPNEDVQLGAYGARGMRWRSLWFEVAADEKDGEAGFLEVRGFRQFPTAASRWELVGTEEIYGHSPVREVMPDVKQLQHVDEVKVELVDLALTPPTQGPAGVDLPSTLSGAFNQLPAAAGAAKIEPLWQPDYRAIQEARISVQELEYRIRTGLHEDLWRLLVDRDQEGRPPDMTATEVATRHEEALTLLGPVVDLKHNDLLTPIIRRTLSIAADRHLLPPPPRELVEALVAGEDVRIEYMSVLAQAQRLLGLGAIERYSSIALQLAQAKPEILDKIDGDELLDQAADMLGIPPGINRPDDEVYDIRVSRARQQAQQMAAQQAAVQAKATRDLAAAPLGQDSALSRLLTAYGPAAEATQSPGGGGLA